MAEVIPLTSRPAPVSRVSTSRTFSTHKQQREALMRKRHGFTLTELFVAIGAIAVLVSLVVPVASKARSAANAASCLSNLRQMGTAFTMYEMENHSALVPYLWNSPLPDFPAYD